MTYPKIDYTNYKGERRLRDVIPLDLKFERDNLYHGNAWILDAYDVEKRQVRSFDLKSIHNPEVLSDYTFVIGH